jgi:hypothetical protein
MVELVAGFGSMLLFLGAAMTWYAREQRRRADKMKER